MWQLTYPQRARFQLIAGCILCFALFWEASKAFGIPIYNGREASLLLGYSPAASLLVVLVVLAISVLLGTLVAGSVRPDAGLFAACVGLAALPARDGSTGDILRNAANHFGSPTPFLVMAGELILLYVFLAAAWIGIRALCRRGWFQDDSQRDTIDNSGSTTSQFWSALGTQALVMMAVVMILCATDSKKQALASIFIGALLGTIVAHLFFAVQPSVWYWTGPLAVGVAGYLMAYFMPGTWQTGVIAVSPARALPLDYASAGPAGAIFGYWMSRRWQRAADELEENDENEQD